MNRSRVSGQREQTVLICALIGAAQMTWGAIVPVLPVYVERFGLGVAVLGPIIAAFAVGRVIANIPAGIALRWWHPRRYLRSVLIALAILTALTGFIGDAALLVAARIVAGALGGAAVTIGFAVLVTGAPPERRGRTMATATVVQMGAAAVGSLLGGIALTVSGIQGAFIAAAIPVVLVVLWDALRPATLFWEQQHESHRSPSARVRPAIDLGLLVALAGIAFAAFFARFAGEQGLIPVLAYDTGGMTPISLGVALAAGTIVSLIVLGPIGRAVDAGRRYSVVLASAIGASIVLLVLPIVNEPLSFGIAIVLYSVVTSVSNIVPGVVTGETYSPSQAGPVIGITRTAGDVGAAVGPLAVFGLTDAFGTGAGLALMAGVLVAASIALCLVLARRTVPTGDR